jgi:hypothetical protein
MTSGTLARGSPPAVGGPLPLGPPHPPHLRRRIQGRKLLRVFSVAQPSRPGTLSARRADLQKLRSSAKAPGYPDLFLLSEGNEADTSSELRFSFSFSFLEDLVFRYR